MLLTLGFELRDRSAAEHTAEQSSMVPSDWDEQTLVGSAQHLPPTPALRLDHHEEPRSGFVDRRAHLEKDLTQLEGSNSPSTDATTEELSVTALTNSDSLVREEAVLTLGETGGYVAIQTLNQVLRDQDRHVREAAVEAFVNVGGEEAALALGSVLPTADASLRAEIVDALGNIGGEAAAKLLKQSLMDKQKSIREAAAEYLDDSQRMDSAIE